MSNPEPDTARKARGGIARARRWTKLAAFVLIVAGLFLGIGWGSLSSAGIGAIAYICPLGSLETLLAEKAATPRFLVTFAVMVVLVALLGRAWCSWICPVPPINAFFHYKKGESDDHASVPGQPDVCDSVLSAGEADGAQENGAGARVPGDGKAALQAAIGSASAAADGKAPAFSEAERAAIRREADALLGGGACARGARSLPPVGGKRDGLQIDSRHGVLAGALIGSALCGFPVFCLICPVGLSIATVVCIWQLFWAHTFSWSLAVFPAIILVEVVFFRSWCRTLCPMAALMSFIGQRSLLKPKVDETRCLREHGVDCRACAQNCPEALDPHAGSLPECTKCGICVQGCPAGAIRMRGAPGKRTNEKDAN